MNTFWQYRVALFYFALFSLNALGTCVVTALTGKEWGELSATQHVIIVAGIGTNWTGLMMAFLSQKARRLDDKKPDVQTSAPGAVVSNR